MKQEIKQRIEQIKNGEVPHGYKKTKIGIVPSEWEIKYLKELVIPQITKNTDKKVKCTLTNSANRGIVKQQEYFDKTISNTENIDGYYLVNEGDYVYNPRISVTAPCGPINKSHIDEVGIVSPLYTVFRFINESNDYYENYFHGSSWYRYMNEIANYGARSDRMNVTNKDFFSMPLPYPPLNEQQKISDILSTQDKVIELKEKLLKEKEKQKKYLMQNLLTGRKRLKGFDGEWKKVKLGDIGYSFSGLSGKTKEDFGKGKQYIPYINIFLNSVVDIEKLEYVNIDENEKQSKVQYGDIFFTISSETAEEVGMSSVLLDHVDELYLNSFCFGFRLNNFDILFPSFASHYFRGSYFRNILNKLAQGATRFNLSKNNLLESEILLPPLEEQKAIAEILTTADKELKLLQEELEEEKRKKKALMQLLLTGIVRVKV